jgi:hypothetical protein
VRGPCKGPNRTGYFWDGMGGVKHGIVGMVLEGIVLGHEGTL